VAKPVPLTTLASWIWIAQVIEVDNAFEAATAERAGRHFRISFPMWSNGLRFIDSDGITVDELRSRAGAACNIGGLERWGWISVGDVGAKRRDGYGSHRGVKGGTVLRPTRAGSYARRIWPLVMRDVEERWRQRFGAPEIDALRDVLSTLVTPMPWSPPQVGPADGFRTHIVEGGATIPADGAMLALLGQVLTAFTIDHERDAEVTLPLGANVLRVTGTDTVRIRDLPMLTGLSKEGIAMAVGYLERHHLALPAPERSVRLTADGLDALDGFWYQAGRVENGKLFAALEALVAQRDALSAGLVAPAGCWRNEKPYLTQTTRLVADPTAALPWHPMVLHRGGWPDAS